MEWNAHKKFSQGRVLLTDLSRRESEWDAGGPQQLTLFPSETVGVVQSIPFKGARSTPAILIITFKGLFITFDIWTGDINSEVTDQTEVACRDI